MGRRRRNDLDELLEAWARWCHSGGVGLGSGLSMLARMIDGKGLITFGSGGPSGPLDAMEVRIEAVVMALAKADQLNADILRLEYCAGWAAVAQRRGLTDYDPLGMGQLENAHCLGVSVRTYRRRLAESREAIARELGKR